MPQEDRKMNKSVSRLWLLSGLVKLVYVSDRWVLAGMSICWWIKTEVSYIQCE